MNEAPNKTGWPMQPLAQDDHRGLFKWFASKPDARLLVREALPVCCNGDCRQGRDCPGRDEALFTQEEDDEPPWSLSDVEPGFWVAIVGGAGGLLYGLYGLVQLLVAGWR